MSALQKILAVLLGAEAEAKRIIEESRNDSEKILQETQDKFTRDRNSRILSARTRANEIIQTATETSKTEVENIAKISRTERELIIKRFSVNAEKIIDTLAKEIAEKYRRKAL